MLSVFITPWTKPTRIHPATMTARALADDRKPFRGEAIGIRVAEGFDELGKVAADREVDEPSDERGVAPRRGQLEVAEPDERRRHAADDRARLELRVAVVEHVAHDVLAGCDDAQGPRRRDAEMVHRLAAEELADRGAEHRAPVGGARVRRRPGALELQLPALAAAVDDLAEGDRAAVAELARPHAELMAAVVRRVRIHPLDDRVSAEHARELGGLDERGVDAEDRRHLGRMRDEPRRLDRRRLHARVERVNLARPGSRFGVARQVADERVVELEGLGHVAMRTNRTTGRALSARPRETQSSRPSRQDCPCPCAGT